MPANKKTLHAIGNAHIDPVWLWRWPEGLETVRATFQSALDRMREYPDFVFTGSSAAFYAWLADVDPGMLEEIAERVREGRWEIVGGWWIQPDANVPSGESLCRQALYGQRFFKEAFGVTATVGYNPDTFGHPGSLPQILRLAGLTRYAFLRPGPHEKDVPAPIFHWRSPDGSDVLAVRIHGAYCTGGDELAEHVVNCAKAAAPTLDNYAIFYGVGNHGGGPTKRNIESLHALADGEAASVRLGRLDAFFAAVDAEEAGGAQVAVVPDELQHHARGCYTVHSEIKRENRRVEHLLGTAERLASVANFVAGRAYPTQDLAEAWQALLFNQFHDILAGTSLPEAYVDARDLFGYSATVASKTLHHSIQGIARQIDTRPSEDASRPDYTGFAATTGFPLVVFNPLPWPVTTAVEIERGSTKVTEADGTPVLAQNVRPTTVAGQRRACFVTDLPALGYKLFRSDVAEVQATPSARTLSVTETTLENDFWRILIDAKTGAMVSLFDKRNGVEALAGPSNVGVVVDDPSDTWSHDVVSFRTEVGRFSGARITVEENGPVRAMLLIKTWFGASSMAQRLCIYRDIDAIECRTEVNWQEQLRMMKLAFQWNVQEPAATYDIPYGSIERACSGEEEPGQQWLDVSGSATDASGKSIRYGVGVTNDSKYGFDVLGSDARISVLRSPAYAHHDPQKLDPAQAYAYIDQGIQTVCCRIVPHAGSWQDAHLPRVAYEANVKPLWVNEYEHEGPLPAEAAFLTCDAPNVVLTVLKGAEDGEGFVVRGYEAEGRAVDATISLPYLEAGFPAAFAPHQIRTWRIDVADGLTVAEVGLLEE